MWFETLGDQDVFLSYFFILWSWQKHCVLFLLPAAAVVISGGPLQIRFWGFRSMMRFLVFETHKTDYFYWSKEPTRFKLLICGLQPGQNFIASLFFRENRRLKQRRMSLQLVLCFFSPFQPQYLTLKLFPSRNSHKALKGAAHCLFGIHSPSPPLPPRLIKTGVPSLQRVC